MHLFPGCFFYLSIADCIIRVKKIELLISYNFFSMISCVCGLNETQSSYVSKDCVCISKKNARMSLKHASHL